MPRKHTAAAAHDGHTFGRKGALRAAVRDDRRRLRAPEIVEPSRRGHGLDPGDVQNALCEAGRCLCAGAT